MGGNASTKQAGVVARIWRSIFPRSLTPRTDQDRNWLVFNTLILHLRPMRVPTATIRYTHTWGLGGMTLVLVTLMMATGVLLMFVYEPVPDMAHASIVRMQEEVLFGRLVRNIHHWSANLLIFVAAVHLLRVFFTGGFHGPRRFNWVVGLTLLLCVLAANFTGYLLPWDQLSYWAITICTGMIEYIPVLGPWLARVILGGEEIGRATVVNFYALHTTVLPVSFVILMALHFWRIRKAGGVVIPPGESGDRQNRKPETVLFLPNLLIREVAVALILLAAVFLLSALFDAPLGEAANPGMSPNPAKAPWYFVGFQELLLHFHPVFAVLVIPFVAGFALLAIPYLPYETDLAGNWFLSAKGRRMAVVAAVTAFVATPLWIVFDEFVAGSDTSLPGLPPLVGGGLMPFAVTLAALAGFYYLIKRRYSASSNEAVQALFVLLFIAFSALTATGAWFRGEGMNLVWPWLT